MYPENLQAPARPDLKPVAGHLLLGDDVVPVPTLERTSLTCKQYFDSPPLCDYDLGVSSWLGILLPQDPTQRRHLWVPALLPSIHPASSLLTASAPDLPVARHLRYSVKPYLAACREKGSSLPSDRTHIDALSLVRIDRECVYSRAALRPLRYHGRYVLFLQPAGCRQIPRVFLEALSKENFPASRQDGARLYGPLCGACILQYLFASYLSL